MPGTVVRDALEVDLLADATLDSATNSQGTAHEAGWPESVQFVLEGVPDTLAADEVLDVVVQGCETSDFSTADVVTLGSIHVEDGDEEGIFAFVTDVDAKYVRADVTTAGAAVDFTGTTLKVVPPQYQRVRGAHPTAQAIV